MSKFTMKVILKMYMRYNNKWSGTGAHNISKIPSNSIMIMNIPGNRSYYISDCNITSTLFREKTYHRMYSLL